MIEKIISWSIHHRFFVWLGIIGIITGGVFSSAFFIKGDPDEMISLSFNFGFAYVVLVYRIIIQAKG